jgi:hypothetical protein
MIRLNKKIDHENFIGSWLITNKTLLDNMVKFFEENVHLHNQGAIDRGINIKEKKTTDITINPIDLEKKEYSVIYDYFQELFDCYNDYKTQWLYLKDTIKILDIPSFNLQRYLPGDHFSKIHTERSSTSTSHRVFAWMTYLNDVKDEYGGKTNFTHFNLKIKPEKGKTLIWPAEWTHAHSGEILTQGKKYIITGWMCFPFN